MLYTFLYSHYYKFIQFLAVITKKPYTFLLKIKTLRTFKESKIERVKNKNTKKAKINKNEN